VKKLVEDKPRRMYAVPVKKSVEIPSFKAPAAKKIPTFHIGGKTTTGSSKIQT
jgi:hypothetical protein